MRLQQEEYTGPPTEEPRYDAETLKKVTALALELQHRHEQTFTARQMEEIGAEAGLGRAFIRRALAQLQAPRVESVDDRRLEPAPRKALDRRKSGTGALARAWWAAGWTLPMLGTSLSILLSGGDHGPPPGFFLGLAAYLGPGILLSAEAKDPGAHRGRSLARAWWGAGWTLPFLGICSAWAFSRNEMLIPLLFFLGLGAYLGVGTVLSHTSGPEAVAAGSSEPQLSRADLLAMLFDLQRVLEAGKQRRAFLSIDVVDSSTLKRSAPELAVEHSFGQLQRWLGEVVRGEGGELHSAAGDGMMSVFPDEARAVRAARAIQQGIDRFNTTQNRLPTPLRLRCGVSAGEVAIEAGAALGSVQSAVIDRAAALQRHAAPGAVVVGGEAFAAAQEELGRLDLLPERIGDEPAFAWRSSYLPPG